MTRQVKIYGSLGLIIGISFIVYTLYKYWEYYNSRDWVRTRAEIIVSEMVETRSGSSRLNLKYSYTVNSKVYYSDNIYFGRPFKKLGPIQEQRIANKYPVGLIIDIYVDPDNPDRSVIQLDTFYSGGPIGSAITGLFFILLSILVFYSKDGYVDVRFSKIKKKLKWW